MISPVKTRSKLEPPKKEVLIVSLLQIGADGFLHRPDNDSRFSGNVSLGKVTSGVFMFGNDPGKL